MHGLSQNACATARQFCRGYLRNLDSLCLTKTRIMCRAVDVAANPPYQFLSRVGLAISMDLEQAVRSVFPNLTRYEHPRAVFGRVCFDLKSVPLFSSHK
jgi:hypothetical protein